MVSSSPRCFILCALFLISPSGCTRDGDIAVATDAEITEGVEKHTRVAVSRQHASIRMHARGHQEVHREAPKPKEVTHSTASDGAGPSVPLHISKKTNLSLMGAHVQRGAKAGRQRTLTQHTETKAKAAPAGQVAKSHTRGAGEPHVGAKATEAKTKEKERLATLAEVAGLTKFFTVCSVVVVIFAVSFEVVHWRWSDVDWLRHDGLLDADPDTLNLGQLGLRGAGAIARRYFTGDGQVFGVTIVAASCALIVAGTLIEKQMNIVSGVYWDALQEKDYDKFLKGLCCFLVMLPAAFLIWAYRTYINGMLTIHWQQSLVRHLQKMWLGHCAYCIGQLRAPNEKVGLENPDQRIEEDAPAFVQMWLDLAFGLLATIPTFVVWMPIVLSLSPDHMFAMDTMPVFRPWLVVAALIWCLLTSAITHLVGRSIIVLTYAKERYDADFRMGLSRIRQNADTIAMLRAEASELRSLEGQFERIKRVFWERLQVTKFMTVVGFLLGQGSDLFPLIFLGHAYFKGNFGLGHFIRIRMAVGNIQDSMSWFVDSYSTIARFRAVSNRLVEMMDHCEAVCSVRLLSPKLDASIPEGHLKLTNAKGHLPTGTSLWTIKDLVIEEGTWTLVRGPEGSGKTTLLRLLAGTWPAQEGTELCIGRGVSDPTSISDDGEIRTVCLEACKKERHTLQNFRSVFSVCLGGRDHGTPKLTETETETLEEECKLNGNENGNGYGRCSALRMKFVPIGAHRLRAGVCLKKAVCYPEIEDDYLDEQVVDALKAVGLEKLLDEIPAEACTCGAAYTPEALFCLRCGAARQREPASEGVATSPQDYWGLHGDHGDRCLSAGESQRLELAHVLLTRPRWCFLDEPVSHVREEEREVLFTTLRSALKEHTTVVTVTHDVASLSALHDVHLELRDGELHRLAVAA